MKPLELSGAYSVPVAPAVRRLIEKWLPDPESVRREINELAYVVFDIRHLPEVLPHLDFCQKGTLQSAWMPTRFRAGSFIPIEEGDITQDLASYRFCFVLHYFSPREPICTPYGDFWWEDALRPAPHDLIQALPYRWPWA